MPVDLYTQRLVYADERAADMERHLVRKRAHGMTWEQEQKFCDEWIAETDEALLGDKFKTRTLPDQKQPPVPKTSGDQSMAGLADWVKLCGGTVHDEKQ